MTDVAFHFNAPDKLAYACRLLRKAVLNQARVVVVSSSDMLDQLDASLWSFSALDFVPHCRLGSPNSVLARSAVILSESTEHVPHRQVLLNLSEEVPSGFNNFERVIEVVSLEEHDRLLARARWKHYAQQGLQMTRHDLALKETA